jgi:hypothetical protein
LQIGHDSNDTFPYDEFPNGDASILKSCQSLSILFVSLVLVVENTGGTVFMVNAETVGAQVFESIARHANGKDKTVRIEEMVLRKGDIKKALSESERVKEIILSTKSVELKMFLCEDSEEFNEIFSKIDKDDSGAISFDQWMSAIKVLIFF